MQLSGDEMPTMKAAVVRAPGSPAALVFEERPVPKPKPGWVRIKVKAFGINRSEMFTRQGLSPSVMFPRILGIEAVGVIDEAPGGEFRIGDTVATVMGGMGRQYDGSYAEFTCVPTVQVRKLDTRLAWDVLGSLPEMLQTAWGAMNSALRIQAGQQVLIRGGTTSVGMAAIAISSRAGAKVSATTRHLSKTEMLQELGADAVLIDDGRLSERPGRFDKILELVGTTTLLDSLQATGKNGIVCMAGMVGGEWEMSNFAPMDAIPNRVFLTTYSGEPDDFMEMPLQALVNDVETGALRVRVGRVFRFDEIVEAHACMERNEADGKIVVIV
jgi:NADPH:quinone reductase-like Zn-dependent oxidoreductase